MKVKNISGGPVHFRVAGVGDVADGEVVEVPDDTVLPAEYFEQVSDKSAEDKPAAKSKSKE